MYKYEMHVHAKDVSPCGGMTAEELVDIYVERGYTGVVLTDHWDEGVAAKKEIINKPIEEWADFYLNGYYHLKEAAEGKLDIFCGMEVSCQGNHFLVYNVTREFIIDLGKKIQTQPLTDVIKKAHDHNCLIFQSHPYRRWLTLIPPEMFRREWEEPQRNKLDGIEALNYGSADSYTNDVALAWSEKYGIRNISGSDNHNPGGCPWGGIFLENKIKTSEELIEILKNGNYALSCLGEYVWEIGDLHPKQRFTIDETSKLYYR